MARFSVSFSRHTNYFDILHHQLPVAVVSALLPVFNIKRISLTCFRVTRYSGETIYPPPFSATSGGPIATLTSGFDLQHRASYWRSIVTTALKKPYVLAQSSRGLSNFPRYNVSNYGRLRSVSPVLTSGTHFLSISGNQC